MTLHQFNRSRVHGASITLCTDTVKPALTSRALPAVNETLAWTIKLLHCFKTKKNYIHVLLIINFPRGTCSRRDKATQIVGVFVC